MSLILMYRGHASTQIYLSGTINEVYTKAVSTHQYDTNNKRDKGQQKHALVLSKPLVYVAALTSHMILVMRPLPLKGLGWGGVARGSII